MNNDEVVNYAKYILEHPAKDQVIDKISLKLMRAFQKGSPEVRDEAARVMDSLDLFFTELQSIVNMNMDLGEE